MISKFLLRKIENPKISESPFPLNSAVCPLRQPSISELLLANQKKKKKKTNQTKTKQNKTKAKQNRTPNKQKAEKKRKKKKQKTRHKKKNRMVPSKSNRKHTKRKEFTYGPPGS